MNLSSLVTDNIADLLVKILQFTRDRHRILVENVDNIDTPGFLPKDLEVEEFADLMDNAISEHRRSGRLLLSDTMNIKFGANGSFKVEPVVDEHAKKLLQSDVHKYLELQRKKLAENLVNHRVAGQLLKQKQRISSVFI